MGKILEKSQGCDQKLSCEIDGEKPCFKICKNSLCQRFNNCIWTNFLDCDICASTFYRFCKNCAKFYNPLQVPPEKHQITCTHSMLDHYVNDGDEITRIFSISLDGVITVWRCRSTMSIITFEQLYWMCTEPVKDLKDQNAWRKRLPLLVSDYYQNGDFFVYENTFWGKLVDEMKRKLNTLFKNQ